MINKMYENELEQIEQFHELIDSLINTTLVRLGYPEHQKREWLKTGDLYVYQLDTIADCYEQFTDIYMKMLKYPDTLRCLGNANAALLAKLYDAFTAYAQEKSECDPGCCLDFGNVEDVLKDPKWHEIQRLAKEVYDALILFREQ